MKKRIALFLLALLSFNAYAGDVEVSLRTPTERILDKIPIGLSEFEKISVYCGNAKGVYPDSYFTTDVILPRTSLIIDRPVGLSYCVATSTDTNGWESAYSNEFTIDMNVRNPPMAPFIEEGLIIKITITISPGYPPAQ